MEATNLCLPQREGRGFAQDGTKKLTKRGEIRNDWMRGRKQSWIFQIRWVKMNFSPVDWDDVRTGEQTHELLQQPDVYQRYNHRITNSNSELGAVNTSTETSHFHVQWRTVCSIKEQKSCTCGNKDIRLKSNISLMYWIITHHDFLSLVVSVWIWMSYLLCSI